MPANPFQSAQQISRAFVALPAADYHAALPGAGAQQYRDVRQLRWLAADNLHLTLAFLGPVSAAQAEQTCAAIDNVAAQCKVFQIRFTQVAPFPQARRAKVLAAVPEQNDRLIELQRDLACKLQSSSVYAPERTFRPHITLARCRREGLQLQSTAIAMAYTATELHFYQSEHTDRGVRYRSLHSAAFAA